MNTISEGVQGQVADVHGEADGQGNPPPPPQTVLLKIKIESINQSEVEFLYKRETSRRPFTKNDGNTPDSPRYYFLG